MIEEALKERSLKVTPKRIAIYNYLYSTKTHPTADEVYSEIKKDFPRISLATVYKTLDTFSKNNIILEINTGLGYSRYDADISLHAHLFCDKCGKLVDKHIDMTSEEILSKVENADNFKVSNVKLLINGTCKDCI